jgi:NAD(P)-dependent dehydrogenase (short-subunit alcohol dehydrogenase family)
MGKFDGKVALVTGAASGIGRATAISFAREGANVVVADMKKDGGLQTVAMIEKMNKKSIFVHCDVSKASEVQNMLDITVKTFGKLDYAFNNAGIEGLQGSTADTTEENYDRVMDINVKGTWLCMKYEIPLILKLDVFEK